MTESQETPHYLVVQPDSRSLAERSTALLITRGTELAVQLCKDFSASAGVPREMVPIPAGPEMRKAAEQGDAVAQCNLGFCYAEGLGVAKDEEEALQWFRMAAEQGDGVAQNNLGFCYANGQGVPKDEEEALQWFRMAADQGLASAQNNLGFCYANGQGVPEDDEEAVKWYRKAAEQGFAVAQNNLGFCYAYGQGVPEDDEEAVGWYYEAAQQGHADAQHNVGFCCAYGRGVPEPDDVEALQWYRKAADKENTIPPRNLSACYFDAQGVTVAVVEAVKWFRKAAEQRDADAQHNVGFCYAYGRGVPKNEEEALQWFHMAADAGFADAQHNLGFCYANGQGVPEDEEELVKWYRKAADLGDAVAQHNLGVCFWGEEEEAVKWFRMAADQGLASGQLSLGFCYAEGLGIAKDEAEAVKWYRKAAEQGDEYAQNHLGVCYAEGRGVPEDHVEAYKWLNLAGPSVHTRKWRDDLGSKMTSQQIAEAQKLSKDWKHKEKDQRGLPPQRRLDALPVAQIVKPAQPAPTFSRGTIPSRIQDLDTLEQYVSSCDACPLAATRTRLVFGSGNPHAKLVFVGEAPGAEEDRQGKLFVGRAEQLLTSIIEKGMKLKRSEVYICNVLKCRPPEGRNPLPSEIEECEPYLIRQLEIIRPKAIFALGTCAAQTLLKTTETIGRLRGHWHFYHGIPLRATYHPAHLLRNPADKRKTWDDLLEVLKVYNGQVAPSPEYLTS